MGEVVIFPRSPPRLQRLQPHQCAFWLGLLEGLPPERQKALLMDAFCVGLLPAELGDRLFEMLKLEAV